MSLFNLFPQYVTIHTVGVNKEQEQIEASITLKLGTFFLVNDTQNGVFAVNSNAQPMIGWSITEEQYWQLHAMLNPKTML